MMRHTLTRQGGIGVLLIALAVAGASRAAGAQPEPQVQPQIEDLGEGRYRIGTIRLDRPAGRFEVPGRVLRLEPPLEFLAVARGGHKAYESLLELDATALEFNLACILLGLDAERAMHPEYHFDPRVLDGDAVQLEVSWQAGGEMLRRPAAELLLDGGKPVTRGEWTYIGSVFTESGVFLAHQDGTLVGLVHDPSSVIEHAAGLGLGSYGDLRAAPGLPAVDSPVMLTVLRVPGGRDAPAAD